MMVKEKLNVQCRCKECKGRGLGWIIHQDSIISYEGEQRSYIDGFVVDTTTGEILGRDDVKSIYSQRPDYKLSLNDCRSIDDFNEHLRHVDLRKLPPRDNNRLRELESEAYYAWKDSNKIIDCRVTAPVMKTLKVLENAISYRNMLAITQADLAKMLGVSSSELMSKLKPLRDRNLVRIRTSRHGVRKGEVILTVNPRFVFRGGDWIQAWYIKQWCLGAVEWNKNNITWKAEIDSARRCTAEQLELNRQGRYAEFGESVKAMRLAQMESPLQLAA